MRPLLLAAALVAAAPATAQNYRPALQPGETVLEVEGEGVFASRPDRMTITAGVVTTGATAREALQANSRLANQMIEAVRAGGVPPSNVQTAELSIRPITDERDRDRAGMEDREPRIRGYVATNELRVELTDLSRASELLDALLEAGANSVRGPTFSLEDAKPAVAQARRLAVADARAEAEAYADALGMRIERVLRVSERSQYSGSHDQIVVTGTRVARAPVEPGEIDTNVTVWIDYALVPE